MIKKRWFMVETEHDSWSGPDIIGVYEYSTYERAYDEAKAINNRNTATKVPDYYITADVSNDLNLTLHPTYKNIP